MLRPNPLDAAELAIPDSTKAYMRSGFDANDGNIDAGNLVRVDPPGTKFSDPHAEWVLFDASGGGVVTSIWLSGRDKQNKPLLAGQMNFYFDGEKIPSFSAQLPELFESGALLPRPLAEKTTDGWVSYALLYYAKSLKITLTNHEDRYLRGQNSRNETIPVLYHQFTYQKLPGVTRSTRLGQEKFPVWKRADTGEREEHTIEIAEDAQGPQTLVEWNGKGIVNGLRLRWQKGEADDATLTVLCDGRKTVSLKVSELWGVNRKHRPLARFRSLLLGFDDETYYLYFPMPHRRQLRIQVDQPGAATIRVEALHQRTLPEKDYFYFHADRVNETPQPGKDVAILRASGAGHFVGLMLEVSDRMSEGDDRFYVDGESFPPAWHGTGTEDYFRGAGGSTGLPATRPVFGEIGAQHPRVAYRFQIADRVNFTHGAVIGFEHGHRNGYSGPYRGVVFWYSGN